MRVPTVHLAIAAMVLTGCRSGNDITTDPPVPTAVSCGDAQQLRQQADDDRRRTNRLESDQEKIDIGNRASFFASLAIIADLKCKVTLAEADEALKPALEAARKAQAASSFYERTSGWGEADFMSAQVIALLIQELPPPPPK